MADRNERTERMARAALEISEAMQSELVGLSGPVQGAVLADLTATFLAAHHPDIRQVSIDRWIKVMLDLVPECEKQIIENYGRYPWRENG